MSQLSEDLKRLVRERAGDRCEYCLSHQDYVMGRLQIDHILPISKGGQDTEENLCLACELCNQYKWNKTAATDPETNQVTSLFNPRQQQWCEHFAWSNNGSMIVGLTTCGRATLIALKLNNSLAVKVRCNWSNAGWHPPQ